MSQMQGQKHVIRYFGKILPKSERICCVAKRELLFGAIVTGTFIQVSVREEISYTNSSRSFKVAPAIQESRGSGGSLDRVVTGVPPTLQKGGRKRRNGCTNYSCERRMVAVLKVVLQLIEAGPKPCLSRTRFMFTRATILLGTVGFDGDLLK